ncbi:MAG: hypothetical protein OJF51_004129 [Nitrospira sp.]|nr:MAG: hypothetical protein OJF51_004129 [Nitrospira sp.]
MRTGTGPETTSGSPAHRGKQCGSDGRHEARNSCAHLTRSMGRLVNADDGQKLGFDAILSLMRASAIR